MTKWIFYSPMSYPFLESFWRKSGKIILLHSSIFVFKRVKSQAPQLACIELSHLN